ncbi:MAG: type II secretion system GspH family protein [Muribaculaceae bacterium]|nr:type II secretion system GspH family protein [Muribaculaceae bacterium]
MRRIAFTLAEVLITLGIIGIVAAMTIPVLSTKTLKRKIETQLKANYSRIHTTLRFMEYDDGGFYTLKDHDTSATYEWFKNFVLTHLKVSHACYNSAGCWHKSNIVKDLNGQKFVYDLPTGPGLQVVTAVIPDGSYFSFDVWDNPTFLRNKFGITSNSNTVLLIYIDVNGKDKPNIIGKDIYIMGWTEKV